MQPQIGTKEAHVRWAADEILCQISLLLLDLDQKTGLINMEYRLRAVEELARESLRVLENPIARCG